MIKKLNEAESYGWVVNDWQGNEAYEFALDSGWWDEDELNKEIVNCLSSEELAGCLAYIFRMHDFRDWEESGLNERYSRRSRRTVNEAGRLVNGKVTKLEPQYDSRKSFYGKAHTVTDADGTQTLYSYNTPVVKIKNGKVELLALWDSSATTLRHVKEFLQQNGFEVGSKQALAKMYGRANESIRRKRRR